MKFLRARFLRLTLAFLLLTVAAGFGQNSSAPHQDAFLVLYCDIPNTRGDTPALDQMLDGALAQLDNAKPAPKTDSTYSGLPARMVTATGTYATGKTTFNVKAYQRIAVQGSRVWQGVVICDQNTNCSEVDANKFLNSIRIKVTRAGRLCSLPSVPTGTLVRYVPTGTFAHAIVY